MPDMWWIKKLAVQAAIGIVTLMALPAVGWLMLLDKIEIRLEQAD